MDKDKKIELEQLVQEVTENPVGDSANITRLLDIVAGNSEAAEIARELVSFKQLARSSVGCTVDDAFMQTSMQSTILAMEQQSKKIQRQHTPPYRLFWFSGVAATLLISFSLYMALRANSESESLRNRVEELSMKITPPETEPLETADLGRIWKEISKDSPGDSPWVLMANGTGKFGYVPVSSADEGQGSVKLLSCWLIDSEGEVLSHLKLLVPVGKNLNLEQMDAGMINDHHVQLATAISEGNVTVELKIKKDSEPRAGISGRTAIGQKPVEIGEFHLGDRLVKTFLQVSEMNDVEV